MSKDLLFVFLAFGLSACTRPSYYLVRSNAAVDPAVKNACLECVIQKVCREKEFPVEDEDALQDRETINFLWWGSLSGPKVIDDVNEKQKPMDSVPFNWFHRSAKRVISNSYILCLLKNGYQWKSVSSEK